MACDTESPLLVTVLLFGPLLLGIFQQLATEPPARSWHRSLHKSPYRPPGYVFPIAWAWSYLSMGFASYLVYTNASASPVRTAVAVLYGAHQVLLNSWGLCFFAMRRMDYALNVILALDVLLAMLLVAVSTLLPFAAALCLPYFCWLLELTYLNRYMYRNNNGSAGGLGMTKEQIVVAHAAPVVDIRAGGEKED